MHRSLYPPQLKHIIAMIVILPLALAMVGPSTCYVLSCVAGGCVRAPLRWPAAGRAGGDCCCLPHSSGHALLPNQRGE
jgi:hypothetical protein